MPRTLTPPKPLLTEEECVALRRQKYPEAHNTSDLFTAVLQSAAALGARKTLEMVRDYHRKGGEIHETWLHKRIREMGGDS